MKILFNRNNWWKKQLERWTVSKLYVLSFSDIVSVDSEDLCQAVAAASGPTSPTSSTLPAPMSHPDTFTDVNLDDEGEQSDANKQASKEGKVSNKSDKIFYRIKSKLIKNKSILDVKDLNLNDGASSFVPQCPDVIKGLPVDSALPQ